MKSHELASNRPDQQRERTFAIVIDKGEEALAALKQFARNEKLGTCQITGVGAFERAKLGYFDRQLKDYLPIEVNEQVEVLSLLGDVADDQNGPSVHLHAVLGLRDGTTRGGHLLEGAVWPTLEVLIRESPTHLAKQFDPETGLSLLKAR